MNKIPVFLLLCVLVSCTNKTAIQHTVCTESEYSGVQSRKTETGDGFEAVQNSRSLPEKPHARSMHMSKSPIKPYNIDSYLFLDDCIYIDLRSADAFYKEGHIAGFTNVPFYGYIAAFPDSSDALFVLTRNGGSYLGDVGSFEKNYEESVQIVYDLFDKNKAIIAVSTAGVESCYFLNLLVQLGYNPQRLYNAGSFTNGMANDPAYRTCADVKYLIDGIELYDTKISYTFKSLTKIQK